MHVVQYSPIYGAISLKEVIFSMTDFNMWPHIKGVRTTYVQYGPIYVAIYNKNYYPCIPRLFQLWGNIVPTTLAISV